MIFFGIAETLATYQILKATKDKNRLSLPIILFDLPFKCYILSSKYVRNTVKVLSQIPTLLKYRGTGMIASSSTFRPHPGRVIRDLFRLLDAVYGIVRKH